VNRALSVIVMAGVILVSGSAVVSTAFTTAEVERKANFTVDTDDNADIRVQPGSAGGASVDGDGELQISYTGLNRNANVTFGDVDDPSQSYVFSFTNKDGTDHTFEVGTENFGTSTKLHVAENTNISEYPTKTEGFTLTDGETAYVAIEIDTGTSDTSGSVYINATGDGTA
jgi:hypothetical protein